MVMPEKGLRPREARFWPFESHVENPKKLWKLLRKVWKKWRKMWKSRTGLIRLRPPQRGQMTLPMSLGQT